MSTWAAISDVQARLTNDEISLTSNPNTTEVQKWLDEGEALIKVELRAAGLTTTITDAEAVLVVGKYVTDYAEARVRMAWASATGGSSTDGDRLMAEFMSFLGWIRANRISFGEAMSPSGSVATSVTNVAAYTTDNTAGLSIGEGDFDPEFTIGMKW